MLENVESLADIGKRSVDEKDEGMDASGRNRNYQKREGIYGTATFPKTREFGYLDAILDFVNERRMMRNGVAEKRRIFGIWRNWIYRIRIILLKM